MTPEQRQAHNTALITKAIFGLEDITYETIAALIPNLLQSQQLKLDPLAYAPANPEDKCGVGRYLIYDHQDSKNPCSIWAFAFAPQQKTSIHDHQYPGTVTILQGVLSEKYYTPIGESKAILSARFDRYRFHTNQDNLNYSHPTAHQLKFRKGQLESSPIAISIHIYAMPAYKESLGIHERNLRHIFSKQAPQITPKDYIPLGNLAPVAADNELRAILKP